MKTTNHDQTAESRQGVRSMNWKQRIEACEKRVKASMKETRRIGASLETHRKEMESKEREHEKRMAPLREEAERAARKAEETAAEAQEAIAEFNAKVAKQRQRIADFRANGAGAKATEMERKLKWVLSERDRRVIEGLDRIEAERPEIRASSAGQGDAIDDEERRHRAEIRRLELDREKRAAEHAAHIQAMEREAARAGLAELRGD